jgi:hypothetical protein
MAKSKGLLFLRVFLALAMMAALVISVLPGTQKTAEAGHAGPIVVTLTTGPNVGGAANSGLAGSVDTYTIAIPDSGGVPTNGSITVTFPAGTTVPSTIANTAVSINGVAPTSAPTVVGRAVTITNSGAAIADAAAATVIFTSAAGIVNPTTPTAAATVNVSTSADATNVASGAYTIVRGLTLSPTTGARGASVTVTGAGFAAGTTATVFLDADNGNDLDAGEVTLGTGEVGSNGAFTATFSASVPPLAAGANNISAIDGAGNLPVANRAFGVNGSIVLTPSTAVPGQRVTVTARDFGVNGLTLVTIGGVPPLDSDANAAANGAVANAADVVNVADGTVKNRDTTVDNRYENADGTAYNVANFSFLVPNIPAGNATVAVTVVGQAAARTATLAIAARALTVTPNTGVVGNTVTVSGTGFPANTNVAANAMTITNAVGGVAALVHAAFTTDTAGSFVVSATLPSNAALVGGTTAAATTIGVAIGGQPGTATFTLNARTVTLSPTSGVRGSQVSFTGAGFPANALVTVNYPAGTTVASVTSSGTGEISGTFNVPVGAAIPSTTTVQALAVVGGVNYQAFATHSVPAASISISPASASSGSQITVSGSNFPAFSAIAVLTIGGNNALPAGAGNTDGTGNFSQAVTVPLLNAGTNTVIVTIGGVTASGSLTVVAAPVTASVTTALATAIQGNALNAAFGFNYATGTFTTFINQPGDTFTQITANSVLFLNLTRAATVTIGGVAFSVRANTPTPLPVGTNLNIQITLQ